MLQIITFKNSFGEASEEKADVMDKLAKVYFTMHGLEADDVNDSK